MSDLRPWLYVLMPAFLIVATPLFMAWSATFIGRTYRDYYLD